MSVPASSFEGPVGVTPDVTSHADLADLWLEHALGRLLDACAVEDAERRDLLAGVAAAVPPAPPAEALADEAARVRLVDASRRALLYAALALEARLNRVLRQRAAATWEAVAHLAPEERFRLAPRLVSGFRGGAFEAAGAGDLAVEVFRIRDQLVDASGPPEAALTEAWRFGPGRARATVEASATACAALETLTDEPDSGTAALVGRFADALAARADALSAVLAEPVRVPVEAGEFPPDLVGS